MHRCTQYRSESVTNRMTAGLSKSSVLPQPLKFV